MVDGIVDQADPNAVKPSSQMQREAPEVDASEEARVTEWEQKITEAKAFWEPEFKRMREDMQLAYAGAPVDYEKSEQFVIPIIKRYVNQAVASIYARNPKVVVSLRDRLRFTIWDGRADSLKAAMQGAAEAMAMGMQPDPKHIAIINEVSQVQQQTLMLEKVARTAQILITYFMSQQRPNFKKQLKQLARRVKTTGLGWMWLGYQRFMKPSTEESAKIADLSEQLAHIESLLADQADEKLDEDSARANELRTMIADLQSKGSAILREGPIFDFPNSTSIIMDPAVKQIDGLVGCNWLAREFYLTYDKVKDNYKIDLVGSGAKSFSLQEIKGQQTWVPHSTANKAKPQVCCWEVYDQDTGQTFTLISGLKYFVVKPKEPEYRLDRFFPAIPLVFNSVEHEQKVIPLSDVHDLRHTQMEYNRSREIRRQHRKAAIPFWVALSGRMSKPDLEKLENRPPFGMVTLNSLAAGEKIQDLLQMFQPPKFDAAMYETDSEMQDVLRTVGAQEAEIGGTSGATATEVGVAEASSAGSKSSNVDDLDEFLSEVVQATGQMLLLAMDIQTVKKIVGPGAVWPEMSREEVMEELMLDIKMGSSGRPNKTAELANMDRAVPMLQQMDEVKMTPIARKYLDLLDVDVEEAIVEGLPSQTALNAMASKLTAESGVVPGGGGAQVGTGRPGTDPNQQGAQGANNAATTPDKFERGPMGAHPAPPPGVA